MIQRRREGPPHTSTLVEVADANAAAAAAVSAEVVHLVPGVGVEAVDGLAAVAGAAMAVDVEVGDIVGVPVGVEVGPAGGHPYVTEDPGTLDLTPAAVGAVVRVLHDVVGGGVLAPALDAGLEVAVDVVLGGNATAPVDLGGIGVEEVVGADPVGVAGAVARVADLGGRVAVVHLGLDGADTNAAAAAAVSAEEVELVPSVGGEAANGLA